MAEEENGTLSDLALSTPPNVLSSKSSDISIEELGNEESETMEAPFVSPILDKNEQDAAEISLSSESGDAIFEIKESNSDNLEKDEINEVEPVKPEEALPELSENTEKSAKDDSQIEKVKDTGSINPVIEVDEDDDYEDETLIERFIGLTEMFPSGIIKTASSLSSGSVGGVKWAYSKGRNISWVAFSTASLLFLPVMIESERVSFEEMEKAKRQQILLGPSSAMSSAGANAPLPQTTV